MKILLIKTSSLGDIIHTFPAITDAANAVKSLEITWVVEENFFDVILLNQNIKKIIPVAFRRWRKNIFKNIFNGEIKNFIKNIRKEKYDIIIDAQGLIKSAIISKIARGKKIGFAKDALTEPTARFFYHKYCSVSLKEHAIFRMRSIFSYALQYTFVKNKIDYGISLKEKNISSFFAKNNLPITKFIFFAHGTTWPSKKWPVENWRELATLFTKENFKVFVPQSNKEELIDAQKIKDNNSEVYVLPKFSLNEIAIIISNAVLVVAVDTGLVHLAAALNIPSLSLYGPSDPKKTGTIGKNQLHIIASENCSPCFKQKCTIKNIAANNSLCLKNITANKVLQTIKINLSI